VAVVVDRLFPIAAVVTPNRRETEVLAGMDVGTPDEARAAAARIRERGARAVLVKGVRDGGDFLDLLVGEGVEEVYRRPELPGGETHGTGCTFSAAIAAGLGRGDGLPAAVARAKDFVWRAIRDARPVGGGSRPLNHQVGTDRG
jgi:hydroxymethylpyrimidine/phosphomethylpyrimidine kinase